MSPAAFLNHSKVFLIHRLGMSASPGKKDQVKEQLLALYKIFPILSTILEQLEVFTKPLIAKS
jgi:hypothetical protein